MIALEPGRGVGEQCKARGVRLRKAVLPEPEDLVEELVGVFATVAVREQPVDELCLERAEAAFSFPGRHRAPQLVGFAGGEPGGIHGDFHDLLLEQRHAERALEHAAHLFARVHHRFQPALAAQVRMHHLALDRSRTHDGDLDHQVIEVFRLEPRQHRHLRARLDLEHADRIGLLDHPVDGRVLGGDVLHPERTAAAVPDELQCAPDGREHAEGEHVDLEQADRVEVVLVPLDDRAFRHGRVLDRHEARNLAAPDHEAAHVLREVPRKAAQRAGHFDQLLHGAGLRVEPGLTQPRGQRIGLVPPREQLGEAFQLLQGKAERPAQVPQGAF